MKPDPVEEAAYQERQNKAKALLGMQPEPQAAPVITGEPGPELPIPAQDEAGNYQINNGILAKLGMPAPQAEAAPEAQTMPNRAPAVVPGREMVRQHFAKNAVQPEPQAPATPQSAYGKDLGDSALVEAQGQRDSKLSDALLARAAQQFASYGGGGYAKPDYSTAQVLEQNAGNPIEDVQTRRKGMDQSTARESNLLSLGNEKDLNDPNSDISKNMRDFAKMSKIPVRDNASAKQMQAILPLYEKYQARQDMLQEKREARADKMQLAKDKKGEAASEGYKALDKKFAENYNNLTSKGHVNSVASLKRLEDIATEMEADTGYFQSGGGRAAGLPDSLRSRDAIRRRDAARNAANETLKETFGSQLSDAERESQAKTYYNDALDNKDNAKLLRDKIAQLRAAHAEEMKKAKFFEDHKGTLAGYGKVRDAEVTPANEAPHGGEYPPGSIVKIKGKNYRVAADGDTLEDI
jgi:hypothetical protein